MTYWIIGVLLTPILTLLSPKKIMRWIYILIRTLPRDIRMAVSFSKTILFLRKITKNNTSIAEVFTEQVHKHPTKVAFIFEDESWTFEQVEELSNKVANYFDKQGFQEGDSLALLLENCAEYSAIWLGLSKCGIATALINTNLVQDPLVHCIKAANCKAIIFGSTHYGAIGDISEKIKTLKLYQFRGNAKEEENVFSGAVDLNQAIRDISGKAPKRKEFSNKNPALYLYTSGSTGLPKAAVLTHIRIASAMKMYASLCNSTYRDVIYTPLPLYHIAGGIIGLGQAFISGSTIVIRKKFSASNYFKDCAKYNVTIAQYIGELCRYLLAVPENASVKHQVRLLLGNGLKPQIWKEVVQKFGIKQIIEFYGATEGIANIANMDGTIGAVAFIPRYLKWAFPVTNIQCNQITGEPIRNEDGYCTECDIGEAGLFIAKINRNSQVLNFEGYTDKEASDKKILRNVFRKGDMYFNSGDILEYDELGYFYFKDRTGDTFRWKGENVSTTEVEAVINNIVKLNDVAVYGVQIPHSDGRAGMAAIVDSNKDIDLDNFAKAAKQCLPNYAVPVFLRIMDSLPKTSTFKLIKSDLKKDGYNINKVKDLIYFYHPNQRKYVELTSEVYEDIEAGKLRI